MLMMNLRMQGKSTGTVLSDLILFAKTSQREPSPLTPLTPENKSERTVPVDSPLTPPLTPLTTRMAENDGKCIDRF